MAGDDELVTTAVAAKHLGVHRSTLSRWTSLGVVTPERHTIGGQARWRLSDLDEQMRDHFHATRAEQRGAAERGESGPPFAPELITDRPPHEDMP